MNISDLKQFINEKWENELISEISEYIKIPCKSPAFDPKWEENGFMKSAVDHMVRWAKAQQIQGMKLQVVEAKGRTPIIFIEISASKNNSDKTVFMYGHLDKQPEMRGWDENKGPWKPVLENDRLYGRGGADDGYSIYAALTAIKGIQIQGVPHDRLIVFIEASEESGSTDLSFHLEGLKNQIGTPDLVICLDSGCGNYDTLWATTSLRGVVTCDMHVAISSAGIHSGSGSGIMPAWFDVVSDLLSRVQNPKTSIAGLEALNVEIPEINKQQANVSATLLGEQFKLNFPLLEGVSPLCEDISTLLLNQSWKPCLTVTGISQVPDLKDAGNVILPEVTLKLSLRIPPTASVVVAEKALKKVLEENTPYGVKVTLTNFNSGGGWKAPTPSQWLIKAADWAANKGFSKPAAFVGEGGSIPFMGMLGEMYPKAQFFITGVLGPKSNAHGPNEFLHIPMVKNLTVSISCLIAGHADPELLSK